LPIRFWSQQWSTSMHGRSVNLLTQSNLDYRLVLISNWLISCFFRSITASSRSLWISALLTSVWRITIIIRQMNALRYVLEFEKNYEMLHLFSNAQAKWV
jgi:hypothetical protein